MQKFLQTVTAKVVSADTQCQLTVIGYFDIFFSFKFLFQKSKVCKYHLITSRPIRITKLNTRDVNVKPRYTDLSLVSVR